MGRLLGLVLGLVVLGVVAGSAYLMFADVPAPVKTIETPVPSDRLGAN
jgi:hypothetical protein